MRSTTLLVEWGFSVGKMVGFTKRFRNLQFLSLLKIVIGHPMIKHFVINISPSRVSIFSTSILVIVIVIVSISTVIVTIVLMIHCLTPETRSQDC